MNDRLYVVIIQRQFSGRIEYLLKNKGELQYETSVFADNAGLFLHSDLEDMYRYRKLRSNLIGDDQVFVQEVLIDPKRNSLEDFAKKVV